MEKPGKTLRQTGQPPGKTGLATAANRTGHSGKPDWPQGQTGLATAANRTPAWKNRTDRHNTGGGSRNTGPERMMNHY
ncbi:MAG: hypothetical protein MUE37_05865 [Bacteroidales bacterium]|nr:hypothetical protein [Bacteroidales bacterium]